MLVLQFACAASDPGGEDTPASARPLSLCINVAIGATATAQSAFPGYDAARINDGDRNTTVGGLTSWANADAYGPDGFLPNWVSLDFGGPRTFDRVDLYTTSSYEIQNYDIQALSAGAWTTIASVRGNLSMLITTTFTAVTTNQLRILGLRGPEVQPQYVRVNELEVLSCSTTATTQVSGQITRRDGTPLAGIAVEVGGVTVFTNASGNYVVSNLPFGNYTVHPSGGGYTFGSAQFQIDTYSRSLTAGSPNVIVNMTGYNRNPIVYVHGWTDSPKRFDPNPSLALTAAGYKAYFAALETSPGWTPPFATNVGRVSDKIAQAKYETGQPKVILVAHSMGGLVARTYLETGRYNNDVSQFFSFGTPHLGIVPPASLACLPNQPAVCEMTVPGMVLFNLTHWKRGEVDYHEIGGDAPMWTTKNLFCFRLFGRKRCISIPWPDTTFRTAFGWVMGLLILGPDDGLIGTCSAIGQPGTGIDRFVTQETHIETVGHRGYFDWDGLNLSQQSYDKCLKSVLVTNTTATCGTRSLIAWGCVASAGLVPGVFTAAASAQPGAQLSAFLPQPSVAPVAAQRATPQFGQFLAGQRLMRTVVVEGGPTTFSVNVQSGSAALSLIDPIGQVVDPAYVASITGGSPSDPDAEVTTEIPNEAVTYDSSAGIAQYFFPNARPGTWTVAVTGNADVPAGGSFFTSDVGFDSPFLASFSSSATFLTPGTTASFTIQLPPIASSTATMSLTLSTGAVVPLAPTATAGGYTATFNVPATSGYARVIWSVTGTRTDGVTFERGGAEDVQITSTALSWGGVTAESTVARSTDPTLAQAVVLQARINASYAGDAEIAADLVNSSGTPVAHVTQPLSLAIGSNNIALAFSGDDIYASGLNGPYTLTNLFVLDTRAGSVLATSATNAYVTAPYPAARFAPTRGTPMVTTSGPYAIYVGDTLQLVANGVDPEAEALSYAWDLDGNGSYETPGRIVSYTASIAQQSSSVVVGVRVTDPSGNAATATTRIDVSANREVNLALQATASASSSFSGYAPSHVNDNTTSTALDPSVSWANESYFVCDATHCNQFGKLPAMLDLDLGAMGTMTHATLYTSNSLPIQDYDLAIWDGFAWNVVDRVRGNTQLVRTHTFAPTVGSKVRITGYKGPDVQPIFVRVNELQVFGYFNNVCGDGICNSNEDSFTCPSDCAFCGDDICNSNENSFTCPSDCAFCGDDICNSNENSFTCPSDCGTSCLLPPCP